jgi:hypothetical protein
MMPGVSETELLGKSLEDLRAAILANTTHASPAETQSLTELHQELTSFFPSPPSSTPSPVAQIIPRILSTTRHLRSLFSQTQLRNPAEEQRVGNPTTAPDKEQQVGRQPTKPEEQRVECSAPEPKDQRVVPLMITPTAQVTEAPSGLGNLSSCPTIVPFAISPPPGRTTLPPGGDNISYSCVSRRSDALSPPSNYTSRSANPSPIARSTESPQTTTHLGKWRVLRVVHHRGKVTHRTKLQFRVQWEPNDGIVSPDTWLPWNQARWLNATAFYVKTIPLLHYLIPLLPAEPTSIPQTANSTTGTDGQHLRYNRLMNGPDASQWREASAEEFDRLLSTKQTMHFIRPTDKPLDRLASYYNPQCSIKNGTDKRVRGTYGGDRTDYTGAVSTNTASMETVMILLNATVSEPGARFTTADIKDFFLMYELGRPEYMWIPLSQIPNRIQTAYTVAEYVVNGRVMVEITKGIYGLPQASLIAKRRLDAHLATHGYHESPTTGLYKHITRPSHHVYLGRG